MPQYKPGDTVEPFTLTTVTGETVTVPDPETLVHLSFRRFAGCPICHRHVHQTAERIEEVQAAGITEVVLFSSDAERLRKYQGELPFAAVADPDRVHYDAFAVTSSVARSLHPKAVAASVKSMVGSRSLHGALDLKDPHWGMPADLLIAPDGQVLASHYGSNGADSWSVDDLLELAAKA